MTVTSLSQPRENECDGYITTRECKLLKQVYVPPGAGGNFIALHCLWNGDLESFRCDESNEYIVPRQKSTLWDLNNRTSSDDELVFAGEFPELVKYFEVWDRFIEWTDGEKARFSISMFFSLMQHNRFSVSQYEILTRDYFWLPIFDYSMYYGGHGGKSDRLDDFCKRLMDMCWEIHEKTNKDLVSIVHYHPGFDFEGYDYSTDIETLCISIEGCDEYITDLCAIKHNTASHNYNSPNSQPELKRHVISNNIFEQQKSDVVVDYRKIFMLQDENEIRKLFKFFGNEDHFDKNIKNILSKFFQYNKDNELVLAEFDWRHSKIIKELNIGK